MREDEEISCLLFTSMWKYKKISEMIQKEKNTDIARIDTVEPYTGSYNDIVDQGQEEVRKNFHPDIKELDILNGM